MAPSPNRNKRKALKTRGLGFSTKELECLLDCIDEHLPIGPDEWDRVYRDHMGRTKDSTTFDRENDWEGIMFKFDLGTIAFGKVSDHGSERS